MAGTVIVDTINSSVSGTPPVFQANGTQIGTLCRAWVNFNGTGTVAIRASFNVSSITDNGTGDYTVNFTNAMPDVNYAKLTGISGSSNPSSGLYVSTQLSGITYNSGYTTTTTLRILYANSSGINVDCADINIGIFR